MPLGLVLLLIGVSIKDPGAVYSSMTLKALGIIVLIISGILLIAGLIKFGRESRYE
ncbi:MAG: hypothetical protein ACTSYB_18595 [Candidatus Helarchaeota archaeon]